MSWFQREQAFRGKDAMARLAAAPIVVCGAGALGSNLVLNLAKMGLGRLTVIDQDRVEEHNIGTQVYSLDHVGALKAEVLRNLISQDLGVDITARAKELSLNNSASLLKEAELVIDTFDNTKSRQVVYDYCREKNIACLHAGLSGDYGEVRWNENYRVPSDAGLDLCDYPLARNLILLVAALASESLVRYILSGVKENYSVTLQDLCVNRELD